jgi:hypothetical protein
MISWDKKIIDKSHGCDIFPPITNISNPSSANFKKYGGCLMARIQVSKDPSGLIIVSFPYDPLLIATAKTIPGHKWHPVEKYWSFPNTNGTLERVLEAFYGHEIHIDLQLQGTVPAILQPENVTSHTGSRRNGVNIDKEVSGTLKITFPYSPLLAEKVKTLKGRKWQPEEKYWSLPYSEGIVEHSKR